MTSEAVAMTLGAAVCELLNIDDREGVHAERQPNGKYRVVVARGEPIKRLYLDVVGRATTGWDQPPWARHVMRKLALKLEPYVEKNEQ